MGAIFNNNKIEIRLSNTEAVSSLIYKYNNLNKTKESKPSSTASYFISTNNQVSNQILDFLDCDNIEFFVDISKTKEYIEKVDILLDKVSKYDFHGELREYFKNKDKILNKNDSLMCIGYALGTIEQGLNFNRSYLRFNNEQEEVKIFRGVIIALFANLIIEKINNVNIIYPIIKKEVYNSMIDTNDTDILENEQIKNEFRQWLMRQGLANATIDNYLSYIRITSKEAIEDGIIDKSIYFIEEPKIMEDIYSKLLKNEKFNYRKINYNNINTATIGHYINFLKERINGISSTNIPVENYSKQNFLDEVFMSEDKYDSICSILEKKKNIILEGAPGVGKTFMAKRLAYSLLGKKDTSKVKLIQFHQNYSYEDFVEGFRPKENEEGFKLKQGLFYKLCNQASKDENNKYYLIIDEINRGNLSKIFGELLMLIETDKRGEKLSLAYSNEEFTVPENLYIIGLMNTADRSLAIIDYALRRRFAFIKIEPAFNNIKFRNHFNNIFDSKFDKVISIIEKINKEIEEDKSLGTGFKIGHSYFCINLKDRKGNKNDIEDIITYEIIPLLEEYWYDNEDTLLKWKNELKGAIND